MGNMSYCRFENTAKDVQDCLDAIYEGDLDDMSSYEIQGFLNFVSLCKEVSSMFENYEQEDLKDYINNFQNEES